MTLKKKLLVTISMMALTIVMLMVDVWALKSTGFTIGGNINFTAKGIQATISKGTLNYDEAWVTASDANTKMPQIKITNSSTEETLKPYYDQWKGLDLVFNEDGDDVILTFTITNDSDNANEYINASITANAGTSDNPNATVTPSPTSATIASGEENKQTFTITFHITDTDYNASLTGFSIGINLSYEKIEPKTLTVAPNNTAYGSATSNVTGTFLPGDSITLTATANSGYTFMAWAEGSVNGNYVSQDATYTFTATKSTATHYYAIFDSTSTTSTTTTDKLVYTLYPNTKTAKLTSALNYTGSTLTVPTEITVSGIVYKVKSIGTEVFYDSYDDDGNYVTQTLIISEGVNVIEYHAFLNTASNLKNLYIGKDVNLIDENGIFGDFLGRVEKIEVDDENKTYNDGNGSNCIVETATSTLILGCKNAVIPADVKIIGKYSFCASYIESINIPQGVEIIEELAFNQCSFSDSSNIIIPDSVKHIGTYAFYPSRLTSITINATTPPTLGEYVFTDDNDAAKAAFTIYVPNATVKTVYEESSIYSSYTIKVIGT